MRDSTAKERAIRAPGPLLLHGFMGSAAQWDGAIRAGLEGRGHPPVALDLPGHGGRAGETAPEDFTLERTHALIDAVMGPEPRPLVGYSMGGRIALAYAAARPGRVRALVLESASPGLGDPEEAATRRRLDERRAQRLEARGLRAFVDEWERLDLFRSQAALPEGVRARHRTSRLRNDPASLAAALRGLGTGTLPALDTALPALRLPVLLLVGALDTKFVAIAREMATRLPNAQMEVVPEAGHAVHLERPDAWVRAVADFLDRHQDATTRDLNRDRAP